MSDTATIAPAAATTFEACKQAIFPILAAHGIARVTIDYNGEGDEGQVNDVLAFDAAGEQVDLPTVDCERHQLGYDGTIASDVTDLASALDSFATEALCALYMGWEDNAGSCGELEILTEPRTVTLTHNWRIETFDTTVSELRAMSHCYYHALSSVKRWGGKPEDYLPLHTWFDESKKIIADPRHRALRHHAEGIFMLETIFGVTIRNSDGRDVPVRLIGEQHVTEDLGRIPSFADWARQIQPAPWMLRGNPTGSPGLETSH